MPGWPLLIAKVLGGAWADHGTSRNFCDPVARHVVSKRRL